MDEESQLLAQGTLVGHYEIIRHVGAGGMANVYLARDSQLGRRVAIKVIDHAQSSSFSAESFTQEARTLAQFSHPNIVTVFGVGNFAAHAFIAMEFVEGELLRKRTEHDELSIQEVQRIGLAIAMGLREAHANSVVHGDLKPDNIIIARDGRLRILDFGLSKLMRAVDVAGGPIETSSNINAQETKTVPLTSTQKVSDIADMDSIHSVQTGMRGTPPYMAPEQWLGNGRSLAVDMWAFGIILFELMTGKRPYEQTNLMDLSMAVSSPEPAPRVVSLRELPEALTDLVHRCLSKEPSSRPSADEATRVLARLVQGTEAEVVDGDSPFRGLAAFTEEQAGFFFGRDDEIASFIERLREEVVLPIVGASGVGKSSFIQAGVIPRLREHGNWLVLRVRPGSDPFQTLAARVLRESTAGPTKPLGTVIASTPAELAAELYENPKALSLHLLRTARASGARVLLLVDQLEEVCTLVSDQDTRLRFLAAICNAADDPSDPIRVVFTVRDDFVTRLAESADARLALSRVAVLRPPGKEALTQILEQPPQVLGYRYDDATLVQDMIKSVISESSALPLLQFTGSMLWERRNQSDKLLLRSAYASLGGVQGALATHANAIMKEMTESQATLVRSIMLRLVTPDGTRRVTSKRSLLEAFGEDSESVLLRLTSSRLLAVRDVFDEPHLELSHESLVHTWDKLRVWLEEGREELVFLSELEQAAALWEKRGRLRSEVWTGEGLANGLRNLERFRSRLGATASAFVEACQLAERRRKLVRRSIAIGAAVALMAIAVVSIVTAVSFADKKRIAERQTAQAQAEGARSAYQRGDYVAARAQLRTSMAAADSPLVRSLWSTIKADPIEWRKTFPSVIYDVALSPGHESLALAMLDHTIQIVDRFSSDAQPLRAHSDQVLGVAFSPDGKLLASGDAAGMVVIWNRSDGSHRTINAHEKVAWKVAFSSDSKRLVSASWEGRVKVWDVATGELIRSFESAGPVHRALFIAKGTRIVYGTADGQLIVRNVDSGDLEGQIAGTHTAPIFALVITADEKKAISGSEDKSISISDLASMKRVATWQAHNAAVNDLKLMAEDEQLASVSYDGAAKLWRLADQEELGSVRHHRSGISSIVILPDGKWATGGFGDKELVVSRVGSADGNQHISGHTQSIQRLAFSPDGKTIYSAGDDKDVRAWDVTTGEEKAKFAGATDSVSAIDVSPDNHLLATGSYDTIVRLHDTVSGALVREFRGHKNFVISVSFLLGGKQLLSVSKDATARVWSTLDGKLVEETKLPFGPDTASRGTGLALFANLNDGHFVMSLADRKLRASGKGGGFGIAMARDDSRYVVGGEGGSLELHTADGKLEAVSRRDMPRQGYGSFDPSGKRVGFGAIAGAQVWSVDAPSDVRNIVGHSGEVVDVKFSPSGDRIASGGDDGTVRLWDAQSLEPAWRTIALFPDAVLTHKGWRQFGGEGQVSHSFSEAPIWAESNGVSTCVIGQNHRLGQVDHVAVAHAFADGCVLLADGQARFVSPRRNVLLSTQATALVAAEEATLVREKDKLLVFSSNIQDPQPFAVDKDVTAFSGDNREVFTGFADGGIEIINRQSMERRALVLEQQPAGAVRFLRQGPMRTVIVGYANGQTGLWSTQDGALLKIVKLHGECIAAIMKRGIAYVVSSLGDVAQLDMASLEGSQCDVLEEIEKEVFVAWVGGRPTSKSAPPRAACR